MLKHSSSFAPFPPNSFYAQGLRETSPSPPLSPILSQDLDSLRVLIVRFCSETDLSPWHPNNTTASFQDFARGTTAETKMEKDWLGLQG